MQATLNNHLGAMHASELQYCSGNSSLLHVDTLGLSQDTDPKT